MDKMRIFNNSNEIGVRTLVIINESNKPLDLQQIIYYDYLALHYGDVDSKYPSLHPSNPLHSSEFIVKRKIIQQGLEIVIRKGLLDTIYSNEGILYRKNEATMKFLSYFESCYFDKLKYYSHLVATRFDKYSGDQLKNYFYSNVKRWRGEFDKEVLFRGELNE